MSDERAQINNIIIPGAEDAVLLPLQGEGRDGDGVDLRCFQKPSPPNPPLEGEGFCVSPKCSLMELVLDRPEDFLYVRHADAHAVTVVDREFTRSFILARDRAIEDWNVSDVATMTAADAEPILALKPDVVLLGSGARQRFPSQAVLAAFLQRGIGVEVMDNAAAARTWNVLAAEGRNVVAAFNIG